LTSPASNPRTGECVRRGRFLFYDERLSLDSTQSCATCHTSAFAFTDNGNQFSTGVDGSVGTRNSMALINLGWVYAVQAGKRLATGGDITSMLRGGESLLAQALTLDPRDRDALQYLGELRLAGTRWKVARRQAQSKDFTVTAEPLEKALALSGNSLDLPLILAKVALLQAQWERITQQKLGPSLAQGQTLVDGLLKIRPRWAEAMALRGNLHLEEAERASPEVRRAKAAQAHQAFVEAFSWNRHLVAEWKAPAERARQLAGMAP